MPSHAVNFLEVVVTEDYVHTEGFDRVDIGSDLAGTLLGILGFELGGKVLVSVSSLADQRPAGRWFARWSFRGLPQV
jgi:hypothetical protein